MQGHTSSDELRIQYLLALGEVKAARQAVAFSATVAQMQSALARLAGLEESKEDARKALLFRAAHQDRSYSSDRPVYSRVIAA